MCTAGQLADLVIALVGACALGALLGAAAVFVYMATGPGERRR